MLQSNVPGNGIMLQETETPTAYEGRHAAHIENVESAVSSSIHSLEQAVRWPKLEALAAQILGVPASAQAITFNNWSPDPWPVFGTNGARFCTVSRISLTIVKPDPPQKIFYVLTFHLKSDGWTSTPPNTPTYASPLRIDLRNAQGGVVWSFDQRIGIPCGVDRDVRLSETMPVDVFNLITGAGLSMPSVTFWRC